jgi:ADP-ribosylglycohydrolase
MGLALGDALGAPFVSQRAKDIPDPIPAFELPWMGQPPGSTTDATAMARNLVRSLAARDGLDVDDLMARHIRWLASGPPGGANFTRRVLRRAASGASPLDAARAVWEERGPEASAGNGSVAYCGPMGAAYANRPVALQTLAARLSSLTHFDERCRTSVLAVTLATAALIRGEGRDRAVRGALQAVREREGGEELEYLLEEVGGHRPIDGPDRGFCLFAAAAGLQALGRGGGFTEELLSVVSLGGDTGPNAAVAGTLVGAAVGRRGLPERWSGALLDGFHLEEEARALALLAPATEPAS